jgi:hypothetical protein
VERGAVQQSVDKIHIHPDWNYLSEKWDADIAVLTFTKTVEFDAYIQPICLPTDLSVEKYENGVVVNFSNVKPTTIFLTIESSSGWLGKN